MVLAIVLLATGRAEAARQAAAVGLERQPAHAHLLNVYGMACAGVGENGAAIAALEKAIAAEPAFDRPYLNLAKLLAGTGERPRAAAARSGGSTSRNGSNTSLNNSPS